MAIMGSLMFFFSVVGMCLYRLVNYKIRAVVTREKALYCILVNLYSPRHPVNITFQGEAAQLSPTFLVLFQSRFSSLFYTF